MIKHIVFWRVIAQDDPGKAVAIEFIREQLEPLVGVIPGLRSLSVHASVAEPRGNWDAVLLSEFATVEDLQAYQVHPSHLVAGTTALTVCSDVTEIDVEL